MACRDLIRGLVALFVVAVTMVGGAAALGLPNVIGDNMVLQCGQKVPIWGWGDKGEKVTVRFAGQTVSTKVDDKGQWKVTLAKMKAGGPFKMTIKAASGDRTLNDILVGEVWVCSGQSNMEMHVAGAWDAQKQIAAADCPNIRLFTIPKTDCKQPQTNCPGEWKVCSPQTVPNFSATAYYFGRNLNKELKVPVGLINTSAGGTRIESWTSHKALEGKKLNRELGDGSELFNGMVAPLIPYAIRGVIWYQGEANIGQAYQYRDLFPTMIQNWRTDWGQGDFPFYFVQIAPYRYQSSPRCPEMWQAQLLTHRSVPNTGMVVTTDLVDDIKDIHPGNKLAVGHRLALWALAKTYGRKVDYSGPLYKSMNVEGDKIRLKFDYAKGLKSSDGKPLSYFTIAGDDEKFQPAKAQINGNTIIVSSEDVQQPVAVRFAWVEDAVPNLVNKEGLPASPFQTDSWKGVTQP